MIKVIKKILFIVILLVKITTILAQETNVQKAIYYKNLAITNNYNNNYDSAIININEALKFSAISQDNETEGECRYTAALIYSEKEKTKLSLRYFLSAANFYEKTNNTKNLIDIYSQISYIYYNVEAYNKAAIASKKSYFYAKKNKSDYKTTIKILEKTANSYFYTKNNDSTICYYNKLIEEASKKEDTPLIIRSHKYLNITYKRDKKYKEALNANFDIYDLYLKQKDYEQMSYTMNNIGYLYLNLKEYDNALAGFNESLFLAEKAEFNQKYYAYTLMNIGMCHQNNQNTQEAIISTNKALKIWKTEKNNQEIAKTSNIIALMYYESGDIYNASIFSEESIEYAKKIKNKKILGSCYKTYSKILQSGNDYEQALDVYKKHLQINDSILFEQRIHDQKLSQKIYELEKSEKELKLQLTEQEVKNLALTQFQLEAEKREKELELLIKEKELETSERNRLEQSIKLAKQQHEALINAQQIKNLENQKAIQNLQLKQKETEKREKEKEVALLQSNSDKQNLELEKNQQARQKFQWIFGLVIIISALIFYALIMSRRSNRKLAKQKKQIQEKNEELNLQNEEITAQKEYLQNANNEIFEQKQEIENINEEITASIKYAERIQSAILPPLDIMIKDFPEHFLLYKPKDIVSGDFYWSKKIGDYIIIAIADCTGHGVPGAFMSMLGISFLNAIVTRTKFDNAGLILDKLRNKVKKALRQTGRTQEQKDGMDISLLILNKKKMSLQYAGANNPLIIIRDKKQEIIKADRMPIGIHHKEKPFTNHKVELKEGDVLYAYSDGYQDQFGGEKGRKFLSKRFKNTLTEIHQKPATEQKQYLENILENWMAFKDKTNQTHKQVDDILIFGIKI